MKTILKKNQIIIFVIAIMFIAAGYMNYTVNNQELIETSSNIEEVAEIGDATLVSSNVVSVEKENIENKDNKKNNSINKEKEVNTNPVNEDQYFVKSRLDRDKMYSQMLESYEKILSNNSIDKEQKKIAENEVKNINDLKNAIMITENLIKNKGFNDLIILKNGESINVIVKAKKLEDEKIIQIQNIVSREFKVDIENIHISCKE